MCIRDRYRTKEEVEEYKQQDPIEGVRKMILTNKWASEEDLEAMDVVAKNEVEEAVKFAESSPLPLSLIHISEPTRPY